MKKFTLNLDYGRREIAKSAGAIWQTYNKTWALYGDELPPELAPYLQKTDDEIEHHCNTCFLRFDDLDISRQSAKNRGHLATKVSGQIVAECCESCAQEIESACDIG